MTELQYDDSVPLSVTELTGMRMSLVSMAKRIDKILATKDVTGKNLATYIVNGVCDYYGIPLEELKNLCRKPIMVERKRLTAYILRKHTDRSLKEIAIELGLKCHASAKWHIREAESQLSGEFYGNKEFKATYKAILKHLKL
jgi:chromosomal replication initiation ATPase DnaA